ncbi:MAG: glycosyltransferase family 4 protein [Paludibacter sp.]|nr:glycosyltransferase family 4 protein [Paludibacter sp.]
MKILIVSQYFWPEEFRINDLALDLLKRGHEVTVLTGNPNYPTGNFYKGYGFKFKVEDYQGAKIYRVPIISRGNASGIRLALNYLSFAINGSIFAMFLRKKFDASLVFAISPITAVYPALVHKFLFKSKVNLWVQDLWPESVSAAGKMDSSFANVCLIKMVKQIYKSSDKVLVQSEAFIPSVTEKGVSKNQLRYVPNWAEDLFRSPSKISKLKYEKVIPTGFRVMFAGNIGEAQDFDSIIKAAVLTKNFREIKWIIVGDGRKKYWVETEIVRLGLQETVFLMGRYPVQEMPSFFVHADIMLLSLKNEVIFSMTIPSKVQSYLAFGKPIAGMLNGIGAEVMAKAECGYVANAGDYAMLANNIIEAYNQESGILLQKGLNGKEYYNKNFSKKVIIDNLVNIFKE